MKYLIVNSMNEHLINGKKPALNIGEGFFILDSTKGSVEVYKIRRRGLKLIKQWRWKWEIH